MSQPNLFVTTESPTAAAERQPPPRPARYQRDPEAEERVRLRTDEILSENTPMLVALRRAASGYFRARTAGKTYKRDPAIKITISVPAEVGEPEAKLVIHPGIYSQGGRDNRRVTVRADWIGLVLIHLIPDRDSGRFKQVERIGVGLFSDGTVRLGRRYLRTSDVDAERLCSTAGRFLENPAAAVAASGTHCAFCGRALTDPQSRARGIGPECFGHYGDFLRYMTPAGEPDPTSAV
jgi:hypothetical protein